METKQIVEVRDRVTEMLQLIGLTSGCAGVAHKNYLGGTDWIYVLSNRRFLYFSVIYLAVSVVCCLFLLFENFTSTSPTDGNARFHTSASHPGACCTHSAAAIQRCWNDPNWILLKYFPPSILHLTDIKFSDKLVVLFCITVAEVLLTLIYLLQYQLTSGDQVALLLEIL